MSADILVERRIYADRKGCCPAHDADVCEVCPGATLSRKLSPMAEIGERLRTQDNMATAHPMFVVFEKMPVYGNEFADYHSDIGVTWTHDGEAVASDLEDSLEAGWVASRNVPDGYARAQFVEVDSFVTACFTREACERFIEANAHNLRKPFVYVASAHRNREWQAVRAFLLSIAGGAA